LTLAHGIKHVWRGRVTSVIGQNQPASLRGIADGRHFWASAKTIVTEGAKQILARGGSGKYAMHASNGVLQPALLRDGARVGEFLRCNPHWGGVSSGETGDGIAEVLNERFLDRLVERRGVCILYTHLGKLGGERRFGERTVQAFRKLADYAANKIRVTTTSRLLDFVQQRQWPAGPEWPPLVFPAI
jgi:hypothetical protein